LDESKNGGTELEFFRPGSWQEALEIKAAHPDALPIFGGTDVMVDINFDRKRPEGVLDLTRVPEIREWGEEDGRLRVGAGVTYTRVIVELGDRLPGLAMASRTVGSPQIRNRGTVGGNLGTASPAGDALPPLMATDAQVVCASARGERRLPLGEFLVGPKRNALEPDELIVAVQVPSARGPQQFSKIGTRNAMVIAVAAFALALDAEAGTVGTGIGSAGPVVLRADEAEAFIAAELADKGGWSARRPLDDATATRFGELVGRAARPIDDVRGTARYRRHALTVMAGRALRWAWDARRGGA
jgi:CO/xanthine dehydrogenase FAD-binding subunit